MAPRTARSGGAVKRELKAPVPTRAKADADKRRGRLTVVNALTEEEGERGRSVAAFRRRTERLKKQAQGFQMPTEKVSREVVIPEAITIQELANRMAERAVDIIKLLMKQGQMHTINDVIDADTGAAHRRGNGPQGQARVGSPTWSKAWPAIPTTKDRCSRVRRSSPSWVMSITARPRCSMPFARPMWCPAKPVASPSISVPIRCETRTGLDHLHRYAGP